MTLHAGRAGCAAPKKISTIVVALNAQLLRRLDLRPDTSRPDPTHREPAALARSGDHRVAGVATKKPSARARGPAWPPNVYGNV